MNHRHLAFVLNVAERGSFRSAAEISNVTQPTLSAGVKQVEHQLGARIFQRSTRSVVLTEFGRQILPAIRDVVASEEALKAQVRHLLKPEIKLVRIGVSPIVEVSRLVDVFADYRKQNPSIEVVFKECFVDDLHDRLLAETIDLVVLPRTAVEEANLKTVRLYSDPWVFLPNTTTSEEFAREALHLGEIANQQLILTSGYCGLSQATQTMFGALGLPLNLYPGRAISYSAIENWADLGLGAALLPASKVSRGRQGPCLPVLEPDGTAAMLDVVGCWRRDAAPARHIRDLISLLEGREPDTN
jgi:DNA-binding transcriptional LysR family regulator